MTRRAWLTPENLPSDLRVALLAVPKDRDLYAMLKGAITPLFHSYNFELFGAASEDETAAYWREWDGEQNWIVPWNPYTIKLLRLYSAGLIAYWPLWEALGATHARDFGPGAYHSQALVNATWEVAGCGDNQTALSLSGTGSYLHIGATGLLSAFNGDVGAFALWIKANGWSQSGTHYIADIRHAASTYRLSWTLASGSLSLAMKSVAFSGFTTSVSAWSGWHHLAMSWSLSENRLNAYADGVIVQPEKAHTGTWGATVPDFAVIGARQLVPTGPVAADFAHVVLWNRELSAEEIADLATL